MKLLRKNATLAAAIAAIAGMGLAGEASADVYAGSKLEISNLTLAISGVTGGAGITGFTFNLDNTATLNGVSATTPGISSTCNNLLPTCAVSPASPLTAVAANAPGSTIQRVDGSATNFSFFGPNGTDTFANSDSEILTAQLIDGVPTSTVQISEAQIAGSGTAQSSTNVQSNTQFTFTFNIDTGGTLVLDFDANPALYVAVNTLNLIGALAQANTGASFALTSTNGTSVRWTPDGIKGNAFSSCLGVTSCTENNDDESLNNTVGLPGGNPVSVGISDARSGNDLGVSDFGITIAGLQEGSYSLTLAATSSVNVVQRVPEPGVLSLLGAGLAGFGLIRRRKSRKS